MICVLFSEKNVTWCFYATEKRWEQSLVNASWKLVSSHEVSAHGPEIICNISVFVSVSGQTGVDKTSVCVWESWGWAGKVLNNHEMLGNWCNVG